MSTQSESPLFILYGSATGNAEHIAKDLAAVYTNLLKNPDTDTYFPSVVCCELDQFKRKCQTIWEKEPAVGGTKHGVLVVTSTTGNADPPENLALPSSNAKEPSCNLSALRFFVLALGGRVRQFLLHRQID
jgi:sulfite reductase alpha subunit-like flavoprotein